MNNLIINSIKTILETSNTNDQTRDYIDCYDELKKLTEVQQIYKELEGWFEKIFNIQLLEVTVFSEEKHNKTVVFKKSSLSCDEISRELCKYYNIDMNSGLAIEFCLICQSQKQFNTIGRKDDHIQMFLYMVSFLISSISYQGMVKKLTFKDPLTSTYNRKFLIEHLSKLLPLAKRENKNISFLIVGIDRFKAVIDEFNYDIGDKVLINLSNILKKNIRESDLLIRLEGDEFLVALVGISSKLDAMLIAEKLIDAFSKSEVVVNKEGQVIKKTISVGITHYDYKTSIDNILKNADISLHEAKNLGRGRIKEYVPNSEVCVELF